MCSLPSSRIAAGCISRLATTTRISKPDRCGLVTISAAAKNWSGNSHRCWGGVFGNTTGIAPGYKLSLTYWKFELSSEGEFVFDTGNSEGNFFYNWSELSVSPVDWFRFGLVGQRTRAYQAGVDIQRGLLVGFSLKKIDFTTYAFNLDQGNATCVFGVGVSF